MVTSGCASALTCGTAACLTGGNLDLIRRLPDLTGMQDEVIVQKTHRVGYDHAIRACGVRLVEVETREELEAAAGKRTAMLFFLNSSDPIGRIHTEEFAGIGKKLHVPTLMDAAADVPPVENLSKFVKMGFDLVAFSGGKGLRGPQSAGLLLGRRDLIAAARLNTCPNGDTIARSHKVNKEEMLAMLAAVETYLKRDHEADWREWEKRVRTIADSVSPIRGVTTEVWIPPVANHVPHLKVRWDPAAVKLTVSEAAQKLREGEPSIEVAPGSNEELIIGVWMMQPGDAEAVARRLREVLG
jgi:L-seryl-tRNA(Ser) seleniumtransferase